MAASLMMRLPGELIVPILKYALPEPDGSFRMTSKYRQSLLLTCKKFARNVKVAEKLKAEDTAASKYPLAAAAHPYTATHEQGGLLRTWTTVLKRTHSDILAIVDKSMPYTSCSSKLALVGLHVVQLLHHLPQHLPSLINKLRLWCVQLIRLAAIRGSKAFFDNVDNHGYKSSQPFPNHNANIGNLSLMTIESSMGVMAIENYWFRHRAMGALSEVVAGGRHGDSFTEAEVAHFFGCIRELQIAKWFNSMTGGFMSDADQLIDSRRPSTMISSRIGAHVDEGDAERLEAAVMLEVSGQIFNDRRLAYKIKEIRDSLIKEV